MAIKNIIAMGVGFSPGSIKFIPVHGFLASAAEPETEILPSKGLYPKKIRVIDRKGKLRREEEPKPPTVRETIDRLLGRIAAEPPAEVPQLDDAVDAEAPTRPIIPLSEAQRAQVIAALSAVPEEQLLAVGLEQAIETAVQLIKDLEQDDEEALMIILALTVQ